MPNELLIAVIAGLGGMWGWGFADFAAKKTIDKIGSIASLVWAHVFGTIILLFVLLSNIFVYKNPITLPSDPFEWLGLAFFGTLQTIVYLYVYKGFEKGQLAVLSPIFASFAGLVVLLSVFVFGEVLTSSLVPALVFIFGGILLLNLDLVSLRAKKIRLVGAPGFNEIAIATVFATVWTLGWDNFSGGKDWVLYAFLMYAFMTISAYIISRFQKVDLSDVKSGAWKFLWLVGLGEAVAYLAISLGYASTTHTSIIALLSGAFSLPAIILSYLFLKEKVHIVQTVGALIIIAGVILLSV